MNYNYRSDFDFILDLKDANGVSIGFPTFDFRLLLRTSGAATYEVSSIGGVKIHCTDDDGKLHVVLDRHGLMPGRLKASLDMDVPNALYCDGGQLTAMPLDLDIYLIAGPGDVATATVEAVTPYALITAYDLAVANGYVGSKEAFYATLAGIVDAEASRMQAEADRASAEGQRQAAETARAQAEQLRVAAEQARVSAEQARVEAESLRAAAESERANAESARAAAEQDRAAADSGRDAAESARVTRWNTLGTEVADAAVAALDAAERAESAAATIEDAESARAAAEQGRATAESGRDAAESLRASAEASRVSAESERATAETERKQAEQGRAAAEGQRATAEDGRNEAEGLRALAEKARATAESQRVNAEGGRQSAESARATNETQRVNAESARASAETQRASEWLTLKGKAETATEHAEAAAQSVEAVTDRIDALEQGKADKVGTYDGITSGHAKQLLPNGGMVNVASYADRLTASTGSYSESGSSICDGAATIDKIEGLTLKNLVKNGQFENGFAGWEEGGASITDEGDYLHVIKNDGSYGLCQPVTLTTGHKYILMYRQKRSGAVAYTEDIFPFFYLDSSNKITLPGSAINDKWNIISRVFTNSKASSASWYMRGFGPSSHHLDALLDKRFGVRLYDLTELGLANLYKGTDAEQRYADLFSRYIDGIEGVTARKLVSTSANAFDAATMVLTGKAMADDGTIADDAAKMLLCVPVLRSEVGVGKNNGYRIHGVEVEKVGWNPFRTTSGCFDNVYDVAEGATDYAANGDGYLYIQVASTANVDGVVVHPKWSYTDEQLNAAWYAKHGGYWQSESRVPTHYIDAEGHRQEIGVLNGLGYIDPWNNAFLKKDEIDLVNRKYIKYIDKVTVDGSEWWGYDHRGDTEILANGFYSDAKGLLLSPRPVSNYALADGGYVHEYYTEKADKAVWVLNYHLPMLRLWDSKYENDELYPTAADKINAFKAELAANPVTVWFALQKPEVYDLADDTPFAYRVDDFGTEHLDHDGATPQLTATYQPNYVDTIRNSASVAYVDGRISELQAAVASLLDAASLANVEPEETSEDDLAD